MSFKNADRSALEQICERLATMAYEVFMGEMACGLKSVSYNYGRKGSGHVEFEAAFTPFNDKKRKGPVVVQFTAVPVYGETGKWSIEKGLVGYWYAHFNDQRPWRIGFDEGPVMVLTQPYSAHVMSGDSFDRSIEYLSVSGHAEKNYLQV